MPSPQASLIHLSPIQQELLQPMVHRTTSEQRLVKRGHIILEAAELNQIEIWFSILVRRLLSRLSCLSVQELHARILAFIAYYNQTSNGAFHWTYKGPSSRS